MRYKPKYLSPDAPKQYCCYCGVWLIYPHSYNKEHVFPRHYGGGSVIKMETRICCYSCNSWRGDKTLKKWIAEIEQSLDNGILLKQYSEERLRNIIKNATDFREYIINNIENLI